MFVITVIVVTEFECNSAFLLKVLIKQIFIGSLAFVINPESFPSFVWTFQTTRVLLLVSSTRIAKEFPSSLRKEKEKKV